MSELDGSHGAGRARQSAGSGHKGADLIAPGNTYASFDAALAAGVDMIEFDVLPESHGDRLILAHDYEDAARRVPHTLEEALAYFAGDRFAGIELDVDLKLPGYELRVLDALRDAGVLDRALISSQYRSSLELLRAADATVRLGWSVPKVTKDPFRSRRTSLVALVAVQALRLVLPWRAARAIRAQKCDALMVHWRLVTPAARAQRAAGGRRGVRVDGRRAATVASAPRARGHGCDHERSAAIRGAGVR